MLAKVIIFDYSIMNDVKNSSFCPFRIFEHHFFGGTYSNKFDTSIPHTDKT